MELDVQWLARAAAKEPVTLRNIVVQDVETWIPMETADEIVVESDGSVNALLQSLNLPRDLPITEAMTKGIRPQQFSNATHAMAAQLVLLHGYCSPTNPWQSHPSDWTNPQYFLNAKATLSHDAFAQRVVSWSANFGPFSTVGHSQGGAVATHIYNFYWSGMDDNTAPGRLIQTLGTPFQGCGLAGTIADFGDLFGVGCGRNDDLTRSGASLWLSVIASDTRLKVSYFTTTYELGNIIGDYCNLAANIILSWPNDGVTELDYSALVGGTNLGNVQKQCHASGMKYVPQYDDNNRNRQINSAAAK